MKEYLNTKTYEYKLAHTKPDGEWAEIPEGAEIYVYFEEFDGHVFYKDGFSEVWRDGYWCNDMSDYIEYCKKEGIILWQRPQQPEALPFIDDNPQSLCEQYAEIEQVRQAIKVKSGSDSDHALDAMSFGIMGVRAASGGVDATLAERQAQYGCFEDVAFVTENIMSILAQVRVNGLNDLPHTHRMALYMIASKMARIVNGDFNHLDSWHDIGGYSKLIEKLINGEQ